jgi:hypothetical protein
MEMPGLFDGEWFELLQSVSIVFSLLAAAHTMRQEGKERRIENVLALTAAHREIWSQIVENPKLGRILDPAADVQKTPPTVQERLLVQMVVLHVRAAFKASRLRLNFNDEDVAKDLRDFFSLPVPNAVWQRVKIYQSVELQRFIDQNLRAAPSSG